MRLLELKARLTNHLAGEDAFDFHTADDRMMALREAYNTISEKFGLAIGKLPDDGSIPADFYSHYHIPGYYNKIPPPIEADSDEPWRGQYPHVHKIITFYAAYRLYQDKGPEMYERATFWKNLFEEESTAIARTLSRELSASRASMDASPDTWEGLNTLLKYDLDSAGLSPEQYQAIFPGNVRVGALRSAYLEISTDLSLTEKKLDIQLGQSGSTIVALPADFVSPAVRPGLVTAENNVITGGEGRYSSYAGNGATYSIESEAGPPTITVSGMRPGAVVSIWYVARPPALVAPTDKPWGGAHPYAAKLIVIRAMRDLMYGKKETYNLSRFWQNEYEAELKKVKKILSRYDLGQANRVKWGHTEAAISEELIGINWPDRLKNWIERM